MSENGTGPARVSVYFGGTGRHEVCAVRDGAVYRAEAPVPARSGDVKADYNELAKSEELAVSLNSGTAPPLTRANFNAAAAAAEAFSGLWDIRDLPGRLPRELSGGYEALLIPETMRLLLAARGAAWEAACDRPARCFTRGAVSALQPRDAGLIRAINEKLCGRLWDAYPGDWQRIGESAVVRDGEVDLVTLCAACCGTIICTKERRAGSLRAMYTLMPARFADI